MADNVIKRSSKVAFLETEDGTAVRMKGFTQMSKSKSAKEYSRQYVDEDAERTDVMGYAESIGFGFDAFKGDEVHKKIVSIFDEEKVGDEAVVNIISVDLSDGDESGGYSAYKRPYAVVPSSEGDSTDAYTYSGDFKANGDRITGKATISDNGKKCTFTPTSSIE